MSCFHSILARWRAQFLSVAILASSVGLAAPADALHVDLVAGAPAIELDGFTSLSVLVRTDAGEMMPLISEVILTLHYTHPSLHCDQPHTIGGWVRDNLYGGVFARIISLHSAVDVDTFQHFDHSFAPSVELLPNVQQQGTFQGVHRYNIGQTAISSGFCAPGIVTYSVADLEIFDELGLPIAMNDVSDSVDVYVPEPSGVESLMAATLLLVAVRVAHARRRG